MVWTEAETAAYDAEVERRFRERTPARRIDEVDLPTRVGQSEMNAWSLATLGKLPPAVDHEWRQLRAMTYRAMALRVIAEVQPEMLRAARRTFAAVPIVI